MHSPICGVAYSANRHMATGEAYSEIIKQVVYLVCASREPLAFGFELQIRSLLLVTRSSLLLFPVIFCSPVHIYS